MKHALLFAFTLITLIIQAGEKRIQSYFIENIGQVKTNKPDEVLAYSNYTKGQIFITRSGFSIIGRSKAQSHKIDVIVKGAAISKSQMVMVESDKHYLNVYKQDFKASGIKTSSVVLIKSIYEGVDWLWSIDEYGNWRHEFLVNKEAQIPNIEYEIKGADISISKNKLTLANGIFSVSEGPLVLTDNNEKADAIWQMTKANTVRIGLPKSLSSENGFTIDPSIELLWNTPPDEFNTGFRKVVYDNDSNTVTVGYSYNYATPVFPQVSGSYTDYNADSTDVLIMKSDTSQELIWTTFFGGGDIDFGNSVAAFGNGIFVTGYTLSFDLPRATYGNYNEPTSIGSKDAFVARFTGEGKWVWATGYGGYEEDEALDICAYGDKFFISGFTKSSNFPIHFNPGSYYDGSLNFYPLGITNVPSATGFIAAFDTACNRLWSTFVGGNGDDYITSITADNSGLYFAGYTKPRTDTFPLVNKPGAYFKSNADSLEAVVGKFDNDFSLEWSTHFGGTGNDIATSIAKGSCGVFICGSTNSVNLPVLSQANGNFYQPNFAGGSSDGFIAKFNPVTLQREYATYFGTNANDALTTVALDDSCFQLYAGFSDGNFTTSGAGTGFFEQKSRAGVRDGIVLGFDQLQQNFWKTYFGNTTTDIAHSLVSKNRNDVYMAGEGFYNYGNFSRIGGTYITTGCTSSLICGYTSANGVNNRLVNVQWGGAPLGGNSGGGGGGFCDKRLNFQALLPQQNTCGSQCNGKAAIDTANIGGCAPYIFLWSNGNVGLRDTTLCEYYWTRVIDAGGNYRTIYGRFNVFRIKAVSGTSTSCGLLPNLDTLVKLRGGEPPYTYVFRGASPPNSCNTNAIFDVNDSKGCIITSTLSWYRKNQSVFPIFNVRRCGLYFDEFAIGSVCPDISNAKFIIVKPDGLRDTVTAKTGKFYDAQVPGIYSIYIDLNDCVLGEYKLLVQPLPKYKIAAVPPCDLNDGSIIVKFVPDSSIVSNYGGYRIDVALYDTTLIQVDSAMVYLYDTVTVVFNNLPRKNYSIVINDSSCYQSSESVDFRDIEIEFDSIKIDCGKPISQKANVTGGGNNKTYQWSNGDSGSDNIIIDRTGTYTLTVTTEAGCSAEASVTVSGSNGVVIDSVQENINPCAASPFSEAEVFASSPENPSPLFSYLWSNGENNATASQLPPGTSNVIVFDTEGCSANKTVLNTKKPPLFITDSVKNKQCFETDNGAVYTQVNFGYPPFTYNWSNGTSAENATALANGTFHLTVTDEMNCTATKSYFIISPPPIQISVNALPDTCNNGKGRASVSAIGGNGFFTFEWSNGDTTSVVTNLVSGTFAVTVTDLKGCTKSNNISVPNANTLAANVEVHDALCFGSNNGYAVAKITSGTPPYRYYWSMGDTAVSTVSGLSEGNYSVTIVAANGCERIRNFTIDEPEKLVVEYTGDTIVCIDEYAEIYVDAYGGTPPYSSDFYYFPSGPNPVSITDNNGCVAEAVITIVELPAFDVIIDYVHIALCEGDVSEVEITPDGGANPYILDDFDSPYTFSNSTTLELYPGYYFYEILSEGFCRTAFAIDIPDIDEPLIYQANVLPVACGINATQSVEIEIAQGTPPYFINGNAVTTNPVVLNNLAAGYNYFAITDDNNCLVEYGTFIDSVRALKAKATNTPIKCAGVPSTVTVSATGGTYPFTGIGNFSVSGGTYNYLVTDDNGCRDSVVLNIFEPQALVINIATVNIDCRTDSGIVKIFGSGGVKPYTSTIDNNTFTFSDSLILNMEAGSYNLYLTDSNNCSHYESFTLYPAAQLSLNTNVVNVSCHGDSSGYIDIDFISINLPVHINGVWYEDWSVRLENLPTGVYPIEITDTAGCVYYNEIEIFQPTKLNVSVSFVPLRCEGDSTWVTFIATGGTPPYDAPQAEYYWGGASINSTVIDDNGCVVEIDTIIKDAKALEFEFQTYAPKCAGQNGILFIDVIDGNIPAIIFNKTFTDTVSVLLPPGTHDVVIYDKNNCAFEFEVQVPEADTLVVNATAQNLKCFEDASGSVLLEISGGTQPYYFSNAPTSASFNIQNVSAGNFTALISDDENCSATVSVNLSQPSKLLVDGINTQTATCHDRNDAYAEVKVTGGTPPYSYSFDGAAFQTQNSMQALSTGAHNYGVKDDNNCALNSTFSINEFVKTTHIISIDSVRCFGRSGGSFKVYSTDSSRAPYFYALDGKEAQPYNAFYNLISGDYNVVVFDKNQCADSLQTTVFQPKEIDSAVYLNGTLLPLDSFEIYERNYVNFTKQNTLPWSFETFPDNFLIVSDDTLVKTKPDKPFSYTIKVFSDTLSSSCFVEYKGFVKVIEVAKLPNIITPDGDGLNDFWEVDLDVYPNPRVVIFDRWGRIVFETENYANDWNGVNQKDGKSLDDGAYFYVLKSTVHNVEVKDYINILNSKK